MTLKDDALNLLSKGLRWKQERIEREEKELLSLPFTEFIDRVQKEYLLELVSRHRDDSTAQAAATEAKISLASLYRLMKKHGIPTAWGR